MVDILLERGDQGGGHGVLELQVAVRVVLPGAAAHGPVGVGHQSADAGLPDLQGAAIRGDRRLEGQVGVVERVVDRRGGREGVAGQRQGLLDLAGAHMRLAQLQLVQVEGEEGQPGLVFQPLAQGGEADAHQLGVEEGSRGSEARHQPTRLPGAGGERLVERVDGVGVVGIHADLAHQGGGFLEQVDELEQGLRAGAQLALVS